MASDMKCHDDNCQASLIWRSLPVTAVNQRHNGARKVGYSWQNHQWNAGFYSWRWITFTQNCSRGGGDGFFSFSLGKIRETDDILRVRGHADGRCLFRCLRHESVVCHKKTVLSLFVVVVVLRRPNAASWPIDYSHDGGALLKFVWIYPSCLPLFF